MRHCQQRLPSVPGVLECVPGSRRGRDSPQSALHQLLQKSIRRNNTKGKLIVFIYSRKNDNEKKLSETLRVGQAALGLESPLLRKYRVQISGHRYLILKAFYLLLLFGS